MSGRIKCNVKEGKTVANLRLRSHSANIMGDHSIDQRNYAQRHPSSNIQLVMTFPFVDLHLNTSMFFRMLQCVLIALKPQSTKHCGTFLLNLQQTLQNKVRRTDAFSCDRFANHTVRGTSALHIYCITS